MKRWQHCFGWLLAGPLLALLLVPLAASAHEARPAYLAVNETAPGQFSILWRTPVLAGMRLPIVLKLPDRLKNLKDPIVSELSDSLVERRWVDAGLNGLAGERIEFPGLQLTITDVLVRVQMLDGNVSTTLVRPARPWIEVATAPGFLAVAGAYVLHGIEHILFGFDHLLFVLALILIVRDGRVLLWTITAFTAAHSITLSLATLGVVHVPGPPVEAMIALSILLLACEIIRLRYGQASLTSRWPWIVAFSFGLLHGFGFASALTDIGLPQGDIPLALLSFNVGVELGQLMFIGVVLGALFCFRRFGVPPRISQAALTVATYAIGVTAAFWFIERLAGFVS
ncbi:MAG TPA: HupE/UreJ family protein [Geobacterales bacterium]|nr:HupE/UreJ family protein [Geobacterales bacterium]